MTVLVRPVTRWTGDATATTYGPGDRFTYRPPAKLVEDRACSYCWATFTQKSVNHYYCSTACSKRDSAWNRWIRETNHAATHGDVHSSAIGPKLPPAGATLSAAIAPAMFSVEELVSA